MGTKLFGQFWRDRAGAVALEYVLLVTGIGVLVLLAIFLFGEDMSSYWNALNSSIGGAGSS
jgi:Flp pilus assembly pilin Flp